ncbi:DUF6492 family protein [Aquicoccus sp. SU-CL01552]|uniref:DUF6492 family protein n=1 Tax=Aquicoccus sp. SU-CL01552 TaxID=3127656 RepID=UPI003105660D
MPNDTPADGLDLLTCSMARDIEIFDVLARSVDRHVDPDIRHTVIVPAGDCAAFEKYASDRRRIVAQESVLPMRLFALPRRLSALSVLSGALRRPLYLTPRLSLVRGWMIQQILKIEFARRSPARAVMHVDSDVFFVRRLSARDAVDSQGRVRFFHVPGQQPIPAHRAWIEAAADCLGITVPADFATHYIENCVLWSGETTRAMVARIEAAHGRPYHEVLLRHGTISEYFIYGIYADLVAGNRGLAAETDSYCNSFWPETEGAPFDFKAQVARMTPKNCAMAVQSTHGFPVAERARSFEAATRMFSDAAT